MCLEKQSMPGIGLPKFHAHVGALANGSSRLVSRLCCVRPASLLDSMFITGCQDGSTWDHHPCWTTKTSTEMVASCWAVLLYKQFIHPMMDYGCPIWRSAAHTHVRKLQVLQSKCLRIATNAPWYVSNRQIHDDLGIPFFANHIRALTESFDSKLADAGNPLVRQIGRHLCQPRAGWSHLRATDEDWCSAGQSQLPLRRQSSRRND
jgi:hypothetical protein